MLKPVQFILRLIMETIKSRIKLANHNRYGRFASLANRSEQHYKNERVRRLCKGDERTFAEFVKEFERSVFLCCRSLGLSEPEAEDAANETFLAAYRGIKGYNGKASLGTWLWRIAYRQAVNYLRKKQRWNDILHRVEEELIEDEDSNATEILEQREKAEIVWQKVNQLPKLWSVAVILFYREEKSIAEIAKIMNVNKNTVKTYLLRGKKKLGVFLEKTFKGELDEIERT
jgi:RNA polymerase sigma factor (sigma-70 family)